MRTPRVMLGVERSCPVIPDLNSGSDPDGNVAGSDLYAVVVRCDGVLVEVSPGEGSCEHGDACSARLLLPDYEAYRAAHQRIVSKWLANG
jgi:hypothetical protein